MNASRHMAAPLRARKHWSTDRIISAGLAVTACAGIVGVIGVRSMEDSAAASQGTTVDAAASTTAAVSSAGLTETQLDQYAAQLQAEAARLDAYRAQLADVAQSVKSASQPTAKNAPRPAAAPAAKPASKPVSKPVSKPAPKPAPAPKPQSNTKSS
jgi:hypothetical protein